MEGNQEEKIRKKTMIANQIKNIKEKGWRENNKKMKKK